MSILSPAAPVPTPTSQRPDGDYVPALLDRLRHNPGEVIRHSGSSITGVELANRIDAVADALDLQGVRPGVVVAVLTLPNDPAMLVARYATHLLGGTVVHLRSMNPRTDADELPLEAQTEVLETTSTTLIVHDDESSRRARLLAEKGPWRTLTLPDADDVASAAFATHPVDPDACAVVDFTSGTTKAPRLVRQSFRTRGRLLAHLAGDVPEQATRLMSVTPISHTTAPMVDATLLRGGTVDLEETFEARRVLDAFADGVTDIYLAVPHLCELLDHPDLPSVDRSRLRRVIYSGTPAAPRRVAQAYDAFGPAIVQVYGSTETGGISALTAADHAEPHLHRTVGRPFPWVQVELRDADTGERVEDSRAGEVWVRSDSCFDGYWTGSQAMQPPTTDGWVATGDVGAFDEYGHLRLVGRVGGVIKRGGIKVYPESVENALREHPSVNEAVVQAVRDSDRREQIHAVVTVAGDAAVPEDELIELVSDRLSPLHAPTQIVFWHGVPLLRSGKPDRRLVRELAGG